MSTNHSDRIFSVLKDGAAMAKSAVAASWSRSLVQHGIDPQKPRRPEALSEGEFQARYERAAPLVNSARDTLDRLFQSVGDSGCCIVLSDETGLILDRRIGKTRDFYFQDLKPGTIWSEASMGTNGVGTSLKEARAITINREQHFMAGNTDLTCVAVPVRDAGGKVAAALDVSICRNDMTPSTLRLIEAVTWDAAQKIEARYFSEIFRNARILMIPDNGQVAGGAIAVDRHDLVIGANAIARRTYGLTDKDFERPFPASQILASAEAVFDDLEDAEFGAVQRALARANGNVSVAAKFLGISRITLHRKIARFRQRDTTSLEAISL